MVGQHAPEFTVCIAANIDYSIDAIYIVKAKDINIFPSTSGRFTVRHAVSVIKDGKYPSGNLYFATCVELFEKGHVLKVPNDQMLTELLR